MRLRSFAIVCLTCIMLNLLAGAHEANAQGALPIASGTLAAAAPGNQVNGIERRVPETTAAPATCQVGVYLLSLRNFSFSDNTFDATFWLWLICPDTLAKPTNTLEFVNADSIDQTIGDEEHTEDRIYQPMKVSGTFRHQWDLTKFPFDQHTLELTTGSLVYDPDMAQSGYHPDSTNDTWRITAFDIAAAPYTYNTTFGDPNMAQGNTSSAYSRLKVGITFERTAYTGFLELTSVVYIAFLLSLISFLIHVDTTTDLGTRLALVSGALFAAAINLQVATTSLGDPSALSLVDKIHLIAFGAIFFAALVAITSRLLLDMNRSRTSVRWLNYTAIAVSTIVFVASNLVVINSATHVV